jgi:acyl-CoA thioesterase-1
MGRCNTVLAVGIASLLLAACMQPDSDGEPRRTGSAPIDAAAVEAGPLVAFLGDSISAGLGVAKDQAFPAVVGELLREKQVPVRILNAGLSGDTTAGGLARLDGVLRQRPDVIVVELGANDALRGLPLDNTERNLRSLIERIRESGTSVLLLGMHIPTNYGRDYTAAFARIYPRLAEELDVPVVLSFLEGVGGKRAMNLPDGLHPNPEGHRRLAANILPDLAKIVTDLLHAKVSMATPPMAASVPTTSFTVTGRRRTVASRIKLNTGDVVSRTAAMEAGARAMPAIIKKIAT